MNIGLQRRKVCREGRQGCDFAVCSCRGIWAGLNIVAPREWGQKCGVEAEAGRLGPSPSHCFQLKCYPNVSSCLTFLLFALWNPFCKQNVPCSIVQNRAIQSCSGWIRSGSPWASGPVLFLSPQLRLWRVHREIQKCWPVSRSPLEASD